MRFDGIETGKHHRLDLLKTGQRFGRKPTFFGDGIANLGIRDGLDVGRDKTGFAGT